MRSDLPDQYPPKTWIPGGGHGPLIHAMDRHRADKRSPCSTKPSLVNSLGRTDWLNPKLEQSQSTHAKELFTKDRFSPQHLPMLTRRVCQFVIERATALHIVSICIVVCFAVSRIDKETQLNMKTTHYFTMYRSLRLLIGSLWVWAFSNTRP